MGSVFSPFFTWSDSPVKELSSTFKSLLCIIKPSAGRRSPKKIQRKQTSESSKREKKSERKKTLHISFQLEMMITHFNSKAILMQYLIKNVKFISRQSLGMFRDPAFCYMIWIFSYNQASIIWPLSVRVFPPDTVPQWILKRYICHFPLLFALVRFHQIQASRHHSFRLKPDLSHGSWCQTAFLTNRSVYSRTCTNLLSLSLLSLSLSLSLSASQNNGPIMQFLHQ